MSLTDTIITRAYAKANGLTTYFPGSTCPHGHTAKRYTSSGGCIACLEVNKPTFNARKRIANKTAKGKLQNKARKLRYEYDMSLAEYEAQLRQQDHKCAICSLTFDNSKKATMVHVDHNHVTGKVRDFLCNNCNGMLGLSGDNVERLQEGIMYLRRHNVS